MSIHTKKKPGPVALPPAQKTPPPAPGKDGSPAPADATGAPPASSFTLGKDKSTSAGGGGLSGVLAAQQAQLLQLIGGAKGSLYVRIADVKDPAVSAALTQAAKNGVDVHAYLVVGPPADEATVLAAQGLEALGVDVLADRSDNGPSVLGLADGSVLASDGTVSKDTGATSSAFQKLFTERPGVTAPDLPAGQVRLLKMPDDSSGDIVGWINRPDVTSIDLEIYSLQDPAVIQALRTAAESRGVSVRVMAEPKEVGGSNFDQLQQKLGPKVKLEATPPQFDASHNVDHAKFMLLGLKGGQKALLFGTGNLVRSGLGGNPAGEFNNRDFWFADTRTTQTQEAQSLFNEDFTRGPTAAVPDLVVTPDNADQKILNFIGSQQSTLYVYNQSLSDSATINALIAQKKKFPKLDAQVLLGFQPVGSGGANDPAVKQLAAAGIKVQYLTRDYLHAKMIIGDSDVYAGSQNFTRGGLVNNREFGEIFIGMPDLRQQAIATFQFDVAHPKP
jgi:phosphatidylserine/phosphatidylglycerophosphate/cardiolipin synthase-like enzyme